MSHKGPQSLKTDNQHSKHRENYHRSHSSLANQSSSRNAIITSQSKLETPKFDRTNTEHINNQKIIDYEKNMSLLRSQVHETNRVLDESLENNRKLTHTNDSLRKKYQNIRSENNNLKLENRDLLEKLNNIEHHKNESTNIETNDQNHHVRSKNRKSRNRTKNMEDQSDMNTYSEEFSTFNNTDSRSNFTSKDYEIEKRNLIEKINLLESNLKRKQEAVLKIREKYKENQIKSQELTEFKKYKARCLFLQKQGEEFEQKIEILTDLNRNLNVQLDVLKQENNNLTSEIENIKSLQFNNFRTTKSKSEANLYSKISKNNNETKKEISNSKFYRKRPENNINSPISFEKDYKVLSKNDYPSWWLKHMQYPNSDV